MKILLSAYWCAPNYGSEQATGWNFAEQLSEKGHEVIVITQEAKEAVEQRFNKSDYPNLTFIYFSLPLWIKKVIFRGTGPLAHLYNFIWQVYAYFFLKAFLKGRDIDLIHHITLGVFRTPVFLGLLGKPFIFGPVGGGETSTSQLQKNLPIKFRIKEKLRHLINLSVLFNPLCWLTFHTAQLILVKTSDNLTYIPRRYHYKCKVSLEVGISLQMIESIKKKDIINRDGLKILFAGRLEYWKGIHLAIKCYAQVLKQHSNVTYTIIGSGTDEAWIKNVAIQAQVYDRINWLPRVSQKELFNMYKQYDILLFPSLHDSSGYIAIEALAHGLPVICLDLGGPKEIVDNNCGYIINTFAQSEKKVVDNLAEAVNSLIANPNNLSILRHNAIEKSKNYTWSQVVGKTYDLIEQRIYKLH